MQKAPSIIDSMKSSYTVAIMSVLGIMAFASAFVVAWPALSYLGSKLVS